MLILHKIHLTCRKSSTLFSMSMHKMETYFPSVSHYLFGSITAVIHHWSGGERHEKCDFSLLLLFFSLSFFCFCSVPLRFVVSELQASNFSTFAVSLQSCTQQVRSWSHAHHINILEVAAGKGCHVEGIVFRFFGVCLR